MTIARLELRDVALTNWAGGRRTVHVSWIEHAPDGVALPHAAWLGEHEFMQLVSEWHDRAVKSAEGPST